MMMDIRDSISKEAGKNLSPKQAEDTKKLFSYLLLTAKNVSLYPEGHSIGINSIKQFHARLEEYIRQNGDVRIEFERNRVICQGIEVLTGQPEEGTLPFTLFRDGIEWLEFNEGIKLEEIREVLSIIHRYSILATEPEGDIVTAFWEARFDHVQYKVSDFFTGQISDQIDRISEPDKRPSATETEVQYKTVSSEISSTNDPALFGDLAIDSSSNNDPYIDPASLMLTPNEQIELQEMIVREERPSTTEHLSMMLDMLLQCREEKDFNIVLEVLSEEFSNSFIRYDFEAILIILDGVRRVLDSARLCTPWAGPLVESFYKDISSDTKCLKPLEKIWSNLNIQQIEKLKLIFQHLTPAAVNTLVNLLLLGQPSQLEQIVEDTIISLVHKDLTCLDSLINNPNEKITETLVHVLSRLEGDKFLKYLMKLARHSSVSVRRMAIKAIGQASDDRTSEIFNFIDDPDALVRRIILGQISQSKNEVAEDLLMQYLQNRQFNTSQNEHVMECFRTLGKCGSSRSVPFLRKILLHRKWMAGFKKSVFREGAALALVTLKIPEAQQLIEAAGKSFYPGLRRIARNAMRELSQKR
ncbi:MAG: hypothetical protein APR62_02170 [Smithella sp. SDB]|nr:MAG: hypothetical protein APR62_02170 [Smithella sp. SDB]